MVVVFTFPDARSGGVLLIAVAALALVPDGFVPIRNARCVLVAHGLAGVGELAAAAVAALERADKRELEVAGDVFEHEFELAGLVLLVVVAALDGQARLVAALVVGLVDVPEVVGEVDAGRPGVAPVLAGGALLGLAPA